MQLANTNFFPPGQRPSIQPLAVAGPDANQIIRMQGSDTFEVVSLVGSDSDDMAEMGFDRVPVRVRPNIFRRLFWKRENSHEVSVSYMMHCVLHGVLYYTFREDSGTLRVRAISLDTYKSVKVPQLPSCKDEARPITLFSLDDHVVLLREQHLGVSGAYTYVFSPDDIARGWVEDGHLERCRLDRCSPVSVCGGRGYILLEYDDDDTHGSDQQMYAYKLYSGWESVGSVPPITVPEYFNFGLRYPMLVIGSFIVPTVLGVFDEHVDVGNSLPLAAFDTISGEWLHLGEYRISDGLNGRRHLVGFHPDLFFPSFVLCLLNCDGNTLVSRVDSTMVYPHWSLKWGTGGTPMVTHRGQVIQEYDFVVF
ncbi:hypothetical protein KIPB_002226 [Kipferlia bialata]|uniref:Uncharacterized protein n=1 Tax=Kipferlia bialata TaxID=797122 RepID=A0A391P0P0_9EUKA|nr:hypothetical protein KIPB_002226 [Kipferlia bialata]|eukprot:g2226.t1